MADESTPPPVSVTASVLHGARDLRLGTRTLPALGADDVRVAVQATGLCGSDLHYFNHFRNGDIVVREPFTLGHESAGVVTAVGSGVAALAPGDRVALEPGVPCETCVFCRAGRYNICRDVKFRASARGFPHTQGTLQESVVQPAKWCHKLPDNVSLEDGALAEPMSVAVHACSRAGLAPGSTVLVLGAGAVGLLCAAASLVVSAAETVVIADIQEERVRFATAHGFAHAGVVVPRAGPGPGAPVEDRLAFARQVADLAKAVCVGGRPVGEFAATYECTGVESCLQTAIYATQPGGKVMLIGMGTPIQTLPISQASLREVDLVGVFRYAHTYGRVIDLLASSNPRLPPLRKLITQRFHGMDDIPRAFDMAARVSDDDGNLVLKVMVTM